MGLLWLSDLPFKSLEARRVLLLQLQPPSRFEALWDVEPRAWPMEEASEAEGAFPRKARRTRHASARSCVPLDTAVSTVDDVDVVLPGIRDRLEISLAE